MAFFTMLLIAFGDMLPLVLKRLRAACWGLTVFSEVVGILCECKIVFSWLGIAATLMPGERGDLRILGKS